MAPRTSPIEVPVKSRWPSLPTSLQDVPVPLPALPVGGGGVGGGGVGGACAQLGAAVLAEERCEDRVHLPVEARVGGVADLVAYGS